MAGSEHGFGVANRGFAHAGINFSPDNLEARVRRQFWAENIERGAHGIEFRSARAADGNQDRRRGFDYSVQSGACFSRP
jgi:hypothetical protein